MSDILQPSAGRLTREQLRQATQVASYVKDVRLKVLPGKSWAPHYPNNAEREKQLEDVLRGRITPEQVDQSLMKPDGFIYDAMEIQELGLGGLIGKVRDVAEFYERFPYGQFAEFLYGLKDKDTDLATATELFSSIARSKIQSDLIKALGTTGKQQAKRALEVEHKKNVAEAGDRKRTQKIFDVLKARWMKKQGIISKDDLRKLEGQAGEELCDIADSLEDAFQDYVKTGDPKAHKKLTEKVRDSFEEIKRQQEEDKLDDFIEKALEDPDALPPEMKDQLEQMFNDFQPPQGGTAPSVRKKLSPSMDPMKKGAEKSEIAPIYTIEPDLTGYYQGQIYSRFNTREVEWDNTSSYKKVNSGSAPKEHVIRSKCSPGDMVPIFMPRNYSPSPFSLPSGIEIYQDEKGCFCLKNNTGSAYEFEIGFGKTPSANSNKPVADETADISSGSLSNATTNYISGLRGKSNVEKAKAIVRYMKNIMKLEYSNDDKYNLIYKKNPSRYFAEIETHKQVDCDVAQTYFIALCRLAGVPSRLVEGHSVDMVKDGKAIIHSGTGHAWTEVWNEQANKWQTIDSTPEKADDSDEGGESGKGKDEDTDIDAPEQDPRDEKEPPSPEEVAKKVEDQLEKTKKGDKKDKTKGSDVSEKTRDKMKKMKEEKNKKKKKSGEKGEKQEGGEPQDGEPQDGESGESGESSESGEPQDGESGESGEDGESGGEAGESVSDEEWKETEEEVEGAKDEGAEKAKKTKEIKDKIAEAEDFKDLKDVEDKLENANLDEDVKDQFKKDLEAKKEKLKDELKKKIEKMRDEGFIDEDKAKKMIEDLNKHEFTEGLERIKQQISNESALYNEYDAIRREIMPLVEKWYKFFASKLPTFEDPEFGDDVGRKGRVDRRAMSKPVNLLFGTLKNPLVIKSTVRPKFMAELVLDISGSMTSRMRDCRKLLIFWAELFERISKEYGYIDFSILVYDENVELVKGFDQKYSSKQRYDFGMGNRKTIKARLMEATVARNNNDMGKAVLEGNRLLNAALKKHGKGFLSALYVFTDGDTVGTLPGVRLKNFLNGLESYCGEWWGKHLKKAFMLGSEEQKRVLSETFGEADSDAVPEMDELIRKSMMGLARDFEVFKKRLPKGG
ncbi:MAG: hypothetical protein UT33_C0018G0002 [Candidatus Peregrinibacteria bacterium GW2011_GWC2_39_14]|nr:MAG: Major sperm protein [Candidatus Peregrinibacteria bacterium GW2011_GWA2_38_36]KKR04650.1 MAG: hypothetical protein UT33_C0018G0002 [Candidatus Peregrinibacteria bacterium GW2011_GWC2_39_14]